MGKIILGIVVIAATAIVTVAGLIYTIDNATANMLVVIGAFGILACLGIGAGMALIAAGSWTMRIKEHNNVAVGLKRNELKMSDMELSLARAQVDQERAKAAALWREAKAELYTIKHDHLGALATFDNRGKPVSIQILTEPHWRNEQPQIEEVQPEALPAPKENIWPLLAKAERRLIAGQSDSGKTTVMEMLVDDSIRKGAKVVYINPHGKAAIRGVPIAGIGRDYDTIAEVLESLVEMMTLRYSDISDGRYDYFAHERIDLYIDEWTSISSNIDNAGELLSTLLTEARKVNMSVTVVSHSTNVKTLDLNSQLRQNLFICWLEGSEKNSIPYAAKRITYGLTGKVEIIEYAHPGDLRQPVYELPAVAFVTEIPPIEVSKALRYAKQGFSKADIYRAVMNKPDSFKCSGPHYKTVDSWLNGQE